MEDHQPMTPEEVIRQRRKKLADKTAVTSFFSRLAAFLILMWLLFGAVFGIAPMKLIHLSDLHIGKWVNGFSMLDDQAFILKEILSVIEEEEPDAVLIAGDIYDKPVPPAEAVSMFDSFLTELSARGREVFVISGNHDSSERVAFGARLMERAGIHISPVYDGAVRPVSLSDADGEVRIYMLPFLKPSQVRRFFPEEEITDYTTAMETAIQAMSRSSRKKSIVRSW